MVIPTDVPDAWQVLADTLLHREALVCRLGEGMAPRDFAGLYVTREDLERVLSNLPGLNGPGLTAAEAVREHLAPELEQARQRFAAALDGDGIFATIARRAHLTAAEAELLALLCAVDTSAARMKLVTYIQDDVQLPRLTLATVDRMVGTVRGAVPGSRLYTAALVEPGPAAPWAVRTLAAADRVVWALAGDDTADPALPVGARRIGTTTAPPVAPDLFLVSAPDSASRLRAVADRLPGHGMLVSPLPTDAAGWRALVREATLADLVVVLELDREPDRELCERVERADHLTWVLSSSVDLPLDVLPRRRWAELRVGSTTADAADWAAVFGVVPDPAVHLTRDQLALVGAAAGGEPERLSAGVRRLAGGHLDRLTVRVRPRRRWTDLVLPAERTRGLREIVVRYRHRHLVYQRWGFSPLPSTGVVALFCGPSGTGKTLAAEIIAGELRLDLYKVNLASVISKYIGETEKNLERIFTAAAAGDLVLFFDEADALFGKRSEISDSHDRYANIGVAYLLQRLESHDGIVVLATNLHRNIDDAFLRRISVQVDFEAPDETARRRIWRLVFPDDAPVHGLDLDFLARQFRITGGIIRNAALGAAFRAAEGNAPITMSQVILALRREFDKMGRLCTEADFGKYFELVQNDNSADAE